MKVDTGKACDRSQRPSDTRAARSVLNSHHTFVESASFREPIPFLPTESSLRDPPKIEYTIRGLKGRKF